MCVTVNMNITMVFNGCAYLYGYRAIACACYSRSTFYHTNQLPWHLLRYSLYFRELTAQVFIFKHWHCHCNEGYISQYGSSYYYPGFNLQTCNQSSAARQNGHKRPNTVWWLLPFWQQDLECDRCLPTPGPGICTWFLHYECGGEITVYMRKVCTAFFWRRKEVCYTIHWMSWREVFSLHKFQGFVFIGEW